MVAVVNRQEGHPIHQLSLQRQVGPAACVEISRQPTIAVYVSHGDFRRWVGWYLTVANAFYVDSSLPSWGFKLSMTDSGPWIIDEGK